MNEDGPGTLIQRRELPKAANMDALEARLVAVQEVPPKMEVRFFAVRGEKRFLLTNVAALSTLRTHAPRKPLGELTETELLVEILILQADAARMRPIYDAAKAWRRARGLGQTWDARHALTAAIDAAIAAEEAP